MDGSLQTQVAVWFLLVSFIIHDAEEVVTIAPWLTRHRRHPLLKLEPTSRLFHPEKSITGQFLIAVIFLGIVIAMVCYLATRSDRTQWGLNIFAGAVGVMLIDGVKHVVVTSLFRSYTPGVITAVLIQIPYAIWTIRHLLEQELIAWSAVGRNAGMGILALPVVLFLAFGFGRVLMPLRYEGSSHSQN